MQGQDHFEVWLSDDNGMRGAGRLLIRITPSRSKRFYFRYSKDGIRTTISLGAYSKNRKVGCLTLEEARVAVRKLASDLLSREKRDPLPAPPQLQLVQTTSPAASERPPTDAKTVTPESGSSRTLLDLCNAYVLGLQKAKKHSAGDFSGIVKRYVATSALASLPARTVTSSQIVDLLRQIIEAGKGRTAAQVRGVLRAAFESAIKAHLDPTASESLLGFDLANNPVASIPSLSQYSKAHDRFLNKTELAYFWRRLQSERDTFDSLPQRVVRLTLLLGGQRLEQLLRVTRSLVDVDAGTIVLFDPKGRRSVPRRHELPLTTLAKAEVLWLLRYSEDVGSSFLFPGRGTDRQLGEGAVSKTVARISRSMLDAGNITTPFGYGDLRRTVTTAFASLGVHNDISNQIQSHELGGVRQRNYDRHDYMEQKLAVLTLWQNFLQALEAPVDKGKSWS